jgi:hypothetical protein
MKQTQRNKTLWFSATLIAMGAFFGYIENTYYQYIDENNVLVESWFMPLSFICIFLGGIGLLAFVVKTLWLAPDKKT